MGWTYHEKPSNVTEWFKDHLTWESDKRKNTCLATAIKFKEAYAAVETINKETGQRYVWAAAFMLNYTREAYYNFGYKDMSEDMGPNISNCPASILDLLTPVDEHPISDESKEWAKKWRERCRKNLNTPKIKFGDKIEFLTDLYGMPDDCRVFEKVRYGRKRNVFRAATGYLIRLSKSTLTAYGYKVLEA
jgi:hypothetical protein